MPRLRQGEIRWANLPAPAGHRPVLILTRNDALDRLTNVTVAPLTRTVRQIASEVVLTPTHGVRTTCAISLDNIITIRKQAIQNRITILNGSTMDDVFAAIRYVFAMSEK